MPSSETGRPRYPRTLHIARRSAPSRPRAGGGLGALQDDVAELGHDREDVAHEPHRLAPVDLARAGAANDPRGVAQALVGDELARLHERERPDHRLDRGDAVALEEQLPVADVVEVDAGAHHRLAQDLERLEVRT